VRRDEEGHVAHLHVALIAPTCIYVDLEHLDLTFQDTADPAVDARHILIVENELGIWPERFVRFEPDLARVEGREVEPVEADAKQAVHELQDLLHGLARDEQASGELPDVAPSP